MKLSIQQKFITILILFWGGLSSGYAGEQVWQLVDAESQLKVEIRHQEPQGKLSYRLFKGQDKLLAWSPLGLELKQQDLSQGFEVVASKVMDFSDKYQLAHGKKSLIHVKAKRLRLSLRNKQGIELQLLFHLQADGLAFNYHIPSQPLLAAQIEVLGEATGFSLAREGSAWMQEYQEPSKVGPAYEYYYEKVDIGDEDQGRSWLGAALNPWLEKYLDYLWLGSYGWAMPALMEAGEHYLMLAEANIDGNYVGTHLAGKPQELTYHIAFPHKEEWLGYAPATASSSLPLTTPWRVIKAGSLKQIVESTLITDLSDGLDKSFNGELPDWIEPGAVAWDWWDYLHTGDMQAQKTYVDAAADFGWPYVLVDANWNLWNAGNPQPHVLELIEYAKSKGVGIHLWYNSGGKHNRITEQPRDIMNDSAARKLEFAQLREWGVRGIKVDFWQSDKQAAMQLYIDLLKDAAAEKLMVNLHGSTMPRGWQRRFPNLMTLESVRGGENYRFVPLPGPSSADNVYYAMTRNTVGPMDYTPVTFEVALERSAIPYSHSLATAMIFESALQHYADIANDPNQGYQKVFAQFPFVKQLLGVLPTAWDETLLLSGHPDSHAVLARRKAGIWYIAGISSSDNELDQVLDLSFLKEGSYRVQKIEQGETESELVNSSFKLNARHVLQVKLPAHAGFVLQLSAIE